MKVINQRHLFIKVIGISLLAVAVVALRTSHAYANGAPPADPGTASTYYNACPPAGQPGQTIHGVYPYPSSISNGTRSASTTLYAQSYICITAPYSSVTNIHIHMDGAASTGTPASFDVGPLPHDFALGDISGRGNWSAAAGVTANMNNLQDGWNCWNVTFWAEAYYPSYSRSGEGSWPVCVYYTFVPPQTTVQGHVFEVDSQGNQIGNVSGAVVDTCNGNIGADGNGFFNWTTNQGTGFCLRILSAPPAGFDGPFIRPWGNSPATGYWNSSGCRTLDSNGAPIGFGAVGSTFPGHCNETTYEWQEAGVSCWHNAGCSGDLRYDLDRSWDGGYDFVYVHKPATVQGRIFKVDSSGNFLGNLSGVTVVTCGNPSATTGGNGFFNFNVPYGGGFCIRIAGGGPGGYITGPFVRPWSEGYESCGGFGGGPGGPYPGHCAQQSYECQVAGGLYASCGRDRSWDGGYDFVYVVPPPLTTANCQINVSPSPAEVGVQFTARFSFTNTPVPNNLNYSVKLTAPGLTILSPNPQSGTESPNQGQSPVMTFNLVTSSPGQYSGAFDVSGDVTLHCPFDNSSPSGPILVGTKPYFRSFGGDTIAGISGSCPGWSAGTGFGGIYGFNDNSQGKGAAAQLAAMAFKNIQEFSSAVARGSSPFPPIGLTFANTGSPGNFGNNPCPQDYYSMHHKLNDNGGSLFLGLSPNTTRSWDLSGNAPICAAACATTIKLGEKDVVYVNGNVTIWGGNLLYQGGSWSIDTIPSLYVIATGNIYIGSSVHEIDGTYISQHGTIYTCADENPGGGHNGQPFPASAIIANCNSQLTVHGSLIAPNIKMLRTINTANQGINTEDWNSTKAAEDFVFSPEDWLTNSAVPLTNIGDYDSISSLPPVL